MALSVVQTTHSERNANASLSRTYQSDAFNIPADVMMIAQVKILRGQNTSATANPVLTDLDGNTWTRARFNVGEITGGSSGFIATYFRYYPTARAGQRLTCTWTNFASANISIDTFAISGLPANRRAAPISTGYFNAVGGTGTTAYVPARPATDTPEAPLLEIATFIASAGGGSYPKPAAFITAGYTEVTGARQDNTASNILGRVGNTGYQVRSSANLAAIEWNNDRSSLGNGFMSELILIPEFEAITAIVDNSAPYLHVYRGGGTAWSRLGDATTMTPTYSRAVAVNPTQGHVAVALQDASAGNLLIFGTTGTALNNIATIDTVNSAQQCEYSLDGKYLLVVGGALAGRGNSGLKVYDVQNNYAEVPFASGVFPPSGTVNCGFFSHVQVGGNWRFWVHGSTGGSTTGFACYDIIDGQLVSNGGAGLATGTQTVLEAKRSMVAIGATGVNAYVWAAGTSDALLRYIINSSGQLSATTQVNSTLGFTDSISPARGQATTWDRMAAVGGTAPRWRQWQASTGVLPNGGPGSPLPTGRPYMITADPDGQGYVVSPGSANGTLLRYDYSFTYRGTYAITAGLLPNRADTKLVQYAPFAAAPLTAPQPQIMITG